MKPSKLDSTKETLLNRLFFWFMVRLTGLLFLVLGPVKKINARTIPAKGGVLIVANHTSLVDPIAIQLASPRRIYFMAKVELFQIPILSFFLKGLRVFPVQKNTADRKAIRQALALLKQGKAVGMFPEGEMSESGKLLPLMPGAALIAKMSRAQVICCGLKNTARVIPYDSLIPRPSLSRIIVRWGEPRRFSEEISFEEIIDWIEKELRALTNQAVSCET